MAKKRKVWLVELLAVWKSVALPKANSSHLKIDAWKTTFLLGTAYFSGANC